MTRDEYADQIGAELIAAHNSKDGAAASNVFRTADAALKNSGFDDAETRDFWEAVDRRFYAGRLLFEKQQNSALHALMQSIRSALDARKQ